MIANMAARLTPATAIGTGSPPRQSVDQFCWCSLAIITYLLAGDVRDFATARRWMWENDVRFDRLLDLICQAAADFLTLQAEASADALMLFDSWASAVPTSSKVLIDTVNQSPPFKGTQYTDAADWISERYWRGLIEYCNETELHVGIDHGVDMRWAAATLPSHLTLQGNLDPLSLIAGGGAMAQAIDEILDAIDGVHISLISDRDHPETPIEHVYDLLARVRGKFHEL